LSIRWMRLRFASSSTATYVLFFLHMESRRVSVAGITRHPDQGWMEQIARSATQETWVDVMTDSWAARNTRERQAKWETGPEHFTQRRPPPTTFFPRFGDSVLAANTGRSGS
jgi:hypothetical protein